MHKEIPIKVALLKIIDDTSPEESGRGGQQKVVVVDKSKYLGCDLCNIFSTEKYTNMYQYVRRMHKEVSTVKAMKRITDTAG